MDVQSVSRWQALKQSLNKDSTPGCQLPANARASALDLTQSQQCLMNTNNCCGSLINTTATSVQRPATSIVEPAVYQQFHGKTAFKGSNQHPSWRPAPNTLTAAQKVSVYSSQLAKLEASSPQRPSPVRRSSRSSSSRSVAFCGNQQSVDDSNNAGQQNVTASQHVLPLHHTTSKPRSSMYNSGTYNGQHSNSNTMNIQNIQDFDATTTELPNQLPTVSLQHAAEEVLARAAAFQHQGCKHQNNVTDGKLTQAQPTADIALQNDLLFVCDKENTALQATVKRIMEGAQLQMLQLEYENRCQQLAVPAANSHDQLIDPPAWPINEAQQRMAPHGCQDDDASQLSDAVTKLAHAKMRRLFNGWHTYGTQQSAHRKAALLFHRRHRLKSCWSCWHLYSKAAAELAAKLNRHMQVAVRFHNLRACHVCFQEWRQQAQDGAAQRAVQSKAHQQELQWQQQQLEHWDRVARRFHIVYVLHKAMRGWSTIAREAAIHKRVEVQDSQRQTAVSSFLTRLRDGSTVAQLHPQQHVDICGETESFCQQSTVPMEPSTPNQHQAPGIGTVQPLVARVLGSKAGILKTASHVARHQQCRVGAVSSAMHNKRYDVDNLSMSSASCKSTSTAAPLLATAARAASKRQQAIAASAGVQQAQCTNAPDMMMALLKVVTRKEPAPVDDKHEPIKGLSVDMNTSASSGAATACKSNPQGCNRMMQFSPESKAQPSAVTGQLASPTAQASDGISSNCEAVPTATADVVDTQQGISTACDTIPGTQPNCIDPAHSRASVAEMTADPGKLASALKPSKSASSNVQSSQQPIRQRKSQASPHSQKADSNSVQPSKAKRLNSDRQQPSSALEQHGEVLRQLARARAVSAARQRSAQAALGQLSQQLQEQAMMLAELHYQRSLISRFGFNPWRQAVIHRQAQMCKASDDCQARVLRHAWGAWRQRVAMRHWNAASKQAAAVMSLRAQVRARAAKRCFHRLRIWAKATICSRHHTYHKCLTALQTAVSWRRLARRDALLHCRSRVLRRTFSSWQAAAAQQASAGMVVELQQTQHAEQHWRKHRLRTALQCWHKAITVDLEERRAAERQQQTWHKINGWLQELKSSRPTTACSTGYDLARDALLPPSLMRHNTPAGVTYSVTDAPKTVAIPHQASSSSYALDDVLANIADGCADRQLARKECSESCLIHPPHISAEVSGVTAISMPELEQHPQEGNYAALGAVFRGKGGRDAESVYQSRALAGEQNECLLSPCSQSNSTFGALANSCGSIIAAFHNDDRIQAAGGVNRSQRLHQFLAKRTQARQDCNK